MENLELLRAWEAQKAAGQRLVDFARLYNLSRSAMKKRLERARKELGAQQGTLGEASDIGPGIFFHQDVNELVVRYNGERIMTIPALLEACQIDLEEWDVYHAVVNKYEAYRKAKQTNLTYDEGLATGAIQDSGGMNIQPLFKVEIKGRKIKPIAVNPVIQPIEINLSEQKFQGQSSQRGVYRTLHISDPHFGYERMYDGSLRPFHDRSALAVILTLIFIMRFDQVVLSGDTLDLAEWTDKFLRSPALKFTTQPAIIEAAWFIAQLKSRVKKVGIIEGNHDERITKTMYKHFEYGYGLRPADRLKEVPPMSIPGLLGLPRMGVDYYSGYPNAYIEIGKDVIIEHGATASKASGQTITNLLKDIIKTTGVGHIHRLEMALKTIQVPGESPRFVKAFSPGCLCHIDGRVPGSTSKTNWKTGFGIIESVDGMPSQIDLYEIYNGKAFVRGTVYNGVINYMEQLEKDTMFSKYLR